MSMLQLGSQDVHSKVLDLDEVLVHLGPFGTFQKRNYLLICLVVMFAALPFSYVFTTRNTQYRCFIEECDNSEFPKFEEMWLNYSIPKEENSQGLKQCHRYAPVETPSAEGICYPANFDNKAEIQCNRFIFEEGDASIERDFNITCDENLWKLTIVGTLDSIGELVFLPIAGLASDKFGRRTMMVGGVIAGSIGGILKALMTSYESFVFFEVFETTFSSGVYSASFILAIELAAPEKRVLGSTLISCAFALGEVLLGLVAWLTESWRTMLLILYTPGLLFVFYFWCVNESVRWLLSKGQDQKAKEVLMKVAKVNGTKLPEDALKKLGLRRDANVPKESIFHVFQSLSLSLRLITCSFIWICCTFMFYGLTLHAVSISGNLYFNFVAVTFVEVPAYIASYYILDSLGRKKTLTSSLIIGGLSSIVYIFVDEDAMILQLLLFLIGKFSITIAFTAVYIYTTELFPTSVRHSMLATCSMFGRIGTMIAPQIPLLARIWPALPLLMFGLMGTASGLLSLMFPETLNSKLPDTIKEALMLSQNNNNKQTAVDKCSSGRKESEMQSIKLNENP